MSTQKINYVDIITHHLQDVHSKNAATIPAYSPVLISRNILNLSFEKKLFSNAPQVEKQMNRRISNESHSSVWKTCFLFSVTQTVTSVMLQMWETTNKEEENNFLWFQFSNMHCSMATSASSLECLILK